MVLTDFCIFEPSPFRTPHACALVVEQAKTGQLLCPFLGASEHLQLYCLCPHVCLLLLLLQNHGSLSAGRIPGHFRYNVNFVWPYMYSIWRSLKNDSLSKRQSSFSRL